jgi:NAD(P)-dependent dehydrogenase (short-subunit alcohol dehydrogenase family)
MTGKIVLITGGNAGIGKASAVELARMGATVVIATRSPERAERAAREIREAGGGGCVDWLHLDLASFASIRRCVDAFARRHDRLDVLINNAAVIQHERSETEDGLETTFGVNHVGHFLLTLCLLDHLKRAGSARIVNMTSTLHWLAAFGLDFDDLQARQRYDGLIAYARSKLANIHFTRELARHLAGRVTVNSLCPGLVATDYAGAIDGGGLIRLAAEIARPFSLSHAAGAQAPAYLASSPALASVTGRHFVLGVPAPVSWAANDHAAARRLWEVTEAYALHSA